MESTRIRRCSYCGNQGHTITTCNHRDIQKFRQICFANKIVFSYKENSRQTFLEWIFRKSVEEPRKVIGFGSRYCRVPCNNDFIDRANKITSYVYNVSTEETLQIANPTNDFIIEHALLDIPNFSNFEFDERLEYTQRAILYLRSTEQQQHKEKEHQRKNIVASIHNLEPIQEEELMECAICYEEIPRQKCIELNCSHSFCGECVIQTLKTAGHNNDIRCSLCRGYVKSVVVYDTILMNDLQKQIQIES